jgi:hypothetical protein
MIVTFIYRYLGDPTIYYGKYISENMSDDSDITLSDFLMRALSPYFTIQFDDYNCDEKIVIGIMAMIPSSVEDNCFSENEKNIFDLFYLRENQKYLPDVYLNGNLIIVEE